MELKISDKQAGLYESMLDEMEKFFIEDMSNSDKPHHWKHYLGYSIRNINGIYTFELEDIFANWIKEFDHECTAGLEDGCSVCGMLIDLGLMKGGDN